MRKRFPTTERFVTTMENLCYVSPDGVISVHRLFDMLTRLSSNARSSVNASDDMPENQRHEWDAITHGLLAVGIDDTERIKSPKAANTTQQKLNVLFKDDDRDLHRLFRNLWKARCAYMALPLSWSGLISGHPIVGVVPYTEELSELTDIADDALRTAKENKIKAHKIDLFILQLWGQSSPLKEITVKDLAKITHSVIALNGLYDETQFDL